MRTLRTLWIALMMSVVMYYVFSRFQAPRENVTPNDTLSLAFIVIGISIILISFLLKSKLLTRAVDQQQVGLVQQAYIVAWAMSEVPALLGLLDFFVTGNPYYYVPMIIAVIGQLAHYPRREHVEQAAFKRSTF
ncbi:MAG TPA: hypothetical protein VFM63_10350 [Pyrinomonadaceae bacterium]|nr:hypothetical protein [Pyrinomonadaceae bacterium]